MTEIEEGRGPKKIKNRRVHMANERTFLAWIRTSIGIMAFGFVVEKFALFLKHVSCLLGKEITPHPSKGYSSFLGISLILLGALMGLLAFIRYKKVEKQIDQDTYQPSLLLDILLTISILVIGIFLAIYLTHGVQDNF